ncbi:MAG TPA: hypothetical protein VKQ30_07985 [Ktedonobacterales bacterium]|nr:hypothetical protein [Ktedonobacterales bacterium]
MRLAFSRAAHPPQRAFEQDPPGNLGMIYSCVEEGCAKLALQACVRCQQRFCTQHIRAWERDLPARGLKPPVPDWYCYQCRSLI